MNNKKMDNKNLVYAVVGVLTLMVAVVGATFAYFTATRSDNDTIQGDMASISFDMNVTKKTSADNTVGLIPMSNLMVEKAVSNASTKGICVDDNGNAVCQIYKINVTNSSSANMFVDGYVTLTGGSGTSADYTGATTTMRWAQAFCTEKADKTLDTCTTAGAAISRQTPTMSWNELGKTESAKALASQDPHNKAEILDTFAKVTGSGIIQGNPYNIINTNYIRVSKRTAGATRYVQNDDVTSALVYNQYLGANDNDTKNDDGASSGTTYVDAQVYYIVVWLTETGTNQTSKENGNTTSTDAAAENNDFFEGSVTFVSAQGNEITSKFNGWTSVKPNY